MAQTKYQIKSSAKKKMHCYFKLLEWYLRTVKFGTEMLVCATEN